MIHSIIETKREIAKVEACLRKPKAYIKGLKKPRKGRSLFRTDLEQGVINHVVVSRFPNRFWPAWIQAHLNQPAQMNGVVRSLPWCLTNAYFNHFVELCSEDGRIVAKVDPSGMVTLSKGGSLELFMRIDERVFRLSDDCVPSQTFDPEHQRINTVYSFDWGSVKWIGELDSSGFVMRVEWAGHVPDHSSLIVAVRPYCVEGISPIYSVDYLAMGALVVNKNLGLVLDQKPDNIVCASLDEQEPMDVVAKWQHVFRVKCSWGLASGLLEWAMKDRESVAMYHPLDQVDVSAWKRFVFRDRGDSLWMMNVRRHYSVLMKHLKSPLIKSPVEYPTIHVSLDSKVTTLWQHNVAMMKNSMWKVLRSELVDGSVDQMALFFYFYSSICVFSKDEVQTQMDGLLGNASVFCDSVGVAQRLILLSKVMQIHPDVYAVFSGKTVEHLVGRLFRQVQQGNRFGVRRLFQSEEKASFRYEKALWVLGGLAAIKTLPFQVDFHERASVLMDQINGIIHAMWRQSAKRHGVDPFISDGFEATVLPNILHNLIAIYPLNLSISDDIRDETIHLVESRFMDKGLFVPPANVLGVGVFQNLFLAQVFLTIKHPTFYSIFNWMLDSALPCGNFPEYVHSQTQSGGWGRGHDHMASAECVMLVRRMMICDDASECLVVFPGVPSAWISKEGATVSFSNWQTRYGRVSLRLMVESSTRYILDLDVEGTPPRFLKIFFPVSIRFVEVEGQRFDVKEQPMDIPFPKERVTLLSE